ncbi:uncharacterized protein SOCEGT47_036170 [Sorangium cellulosum]|uniref:Uncharacterized protein n=2 Tax=Sorangium cellulosum TaxID=56 RepID=A0A4P2Q2B0_SORCE|nr:uncharacterized protein SOCEGT47_036170 [Sorangium cellulosum]
MNQIQETSYLQTARALADAHRQADPNTTLIFLNPDPAEQEVRLLEVSTAAPTSGELYPFSFAARPDLGINYPSVVLLLSHQEWTDLQQGNLQLPDGWTIDRLEKL